MFRDRLRKPSFTPGPATDPDGKLSLSGAKAFLADLRKRPAVVLPMAVVATGVGIALRFSDLKEVYEKFVPPKAQAIELVKQLTDASAAVRLAALAQLAMADVRKPEDVQLGVDGVTLLISRETSHDHASDVTRTEVSRAFSTLGQLLSVADKRKLALRRPALQGLDLGGIDLAGAYLRGITVRDSDLHEVRLDHADMTDAVIEDSQLAHADATAINLSGSRLTRVCLEGAVLAQATLSHAHVDGSDMNTATLTDADLTLATFSETRMSGARMTASTAAGTDLSGATEWTPQQTAQLKRSSDTKLPATYRPALGRTCG
jgi:uncharacterized protein YjbI with pentapeptide repeats